MERRLQIRRDVESKVHSAHARLSSLVGGDFSSGFYNRPEVLQAEQSQGLAICDAVLGHILDSPKNPAVEKVANELLQRVEQAIDSRAVENMCHNLHAALVGMLDRVGCPAIVIWGTLEASAPGTTGFCLPAYRKLFPEQRPGHSWIMTPYHYVADLAVAHQYNVGDDYELLKTRLPRLITLNAKETSEPEMSWFRMPGNPTLRIPEDIFAKETKYHSLLGWSLFHGGSITLRYLPGAVTLPEEADLDDISIEIGGMTPGRFFRSRLQDLSQVK